MPWTFFSAIRLRYPWLVLTCFVLVGGLFAALYSAGKDLPVAGVISSDLNTHVIVIDAGHGGFDPGAVGATGVLEKDIALAVSQKVAALLEMSGAKVICTRTTDEALGNTKKEDIHNRADMVVESNCDIFVTIQANSIPDAKLRGAQVFYHPNSQEGFRLADNVQKEIIRVLNNTKRQALPISDVFLLKNLAIPAVVVEVGFLSNAEEEALLQDADYQNRMAWSIYSGIVNYFAGDTATDRILTE